MPRRLVLLALVSLIALGSGCTSSGKSGGADNAGGTRASAAKHFWLNYPYEPAGRADWHNRGGGKWEERPPDGKTYTYNEVGPYDAGGYQGLVVRRDDNGQDILIPHEAAGSMLRFRPAQGGRNWMNYGQIEGVGKK